MAALFLSRASGRVSLVRWLKLGLVIVGLAWLGAISSRAYGLADRIRSDLYRAQHHYRLDKATIFAGIEIPLGSSVSVDENGILYEIETDQEAAVSIDGASWRGEIRLIPSSKRAASDRGMIKSATLASDAIIQGIACRAGRLVEFSEYGGELQHCTLAQRTAVTAEIADVGGEKSAEELACAADRDRWLRTFGDRLLERCVLADTAMVGSIVCAGGQEIALSGGGLDACTLASAQRVGPLDLAAQTRVVLVSGRLDTFEMSLTSASLTIAGLDLPPGTTVHLCDRSWEIDWLLVPEHSYVTVAGVKLTGRISFDCGNFESGSLFGDTVLRGQRRPRGVVILHEDVLPPSPG
jgi:hypothetical protein